MSPFFDDLRLTMVPGVDPKHGPLPPLLVGMTVVTGLVDAFSYLVLGHVFVANMTGNVVFLGFALARAPGFSIWASLAALASFWLGAFIGGALGSRLGDHRGRLLAVAISLEAVLIGACTVLVAVSGTPIEAGYRYPLIIVLAIALGNQNATARRLAVPDLTTTVLTLTITGTAADSSIVGGKGSTGVRRSISVLSMLVGALIGALLVVHGMAVVALAIAFAVLVIIGVVVAALSEPDSPWATHR
jgi:uncharacterized membrane protein YoaK (UPF0700 family)